MLKALWRYRTFVFGLVARDFRTKYLNSVLGSLWAILHPLAQIAIYTIIFSQVMKMKMPGIDDTLAYSIYLCAGMIHWQFFSEVLSRTQNVFLEQANLLKKASFPRTTLPLYVLLSSAVNYLILLTVFILFLVIIGRGPTISIISILPLLLLQQGLAMGLGIFLGTLNAFFRDVGHVMGIVLQFWFWFTPIIYAVEVLPDEVKWFLNLNPMVWLFQGYQDIFLYGFWPVWKDGITVTIIAGISLLLGYITFTRLDKEMVDEL